MRLQSLAPASPGWSVLEYVPFTLGGLDGVQHRSLEWSHQFSGPENLRPRTFGHHISGSHQRFRRSAGHLKHNNPRVVAYPHIVPLGRRAVVARRSRFDDDHHPTMGERTGTAGACSSIPAHAQGPTHEPSAAGRPAVPFLYSRNAVLAQPGRDPMTDRAQPGQEIHLIRRPTT